MTTFSDLIQMINIELGQASGPDVQLYGEPRIAQMLQREFNWAFGKRFWKQFRQTTTYTLDGTTGVVTTDLSALINAYRDIQHVWLASMTRNPLPEAPSDVNPNEVTQICIEVTAVPAAGYFRVLPITTVGDVTIRYRVKPPAFTDTDEVPFDDDYLLSKCVANFLVMEGTNLKAAEYYAARAKEIWQNLIDDDVQQSKSLYSSTISNVDNWNTR